MKAKTYIDGNGYERFSDSHKSVSRWAAEKKIGRPLKMKEVVHHKDRNKTNNSQNNLFVCRNQKQHDFFHNKDVKKYGKKVSYKGF